VRKKKRVTGVVSRGGALVLRWMEETGFENPLLTYYSELLKLMKKYDCTISLGDGLRPGSLADSMDVLQMAELKNQSGLMKRALAEKVKVIVEGPGHVPLDQIEKQIKLAKKYAQDVPLYVLGPIVTDIAPGYDHITSAIGGTLAGFYGADFLCYVTPSEHLGLPNLEEVKEGVIASKIAAHAADIARGLKSAADYDRLFSMYRRKLNWKKMQKMCLDPEKIRKKHQGRVCSMCGKYCAMKQI